MSQTKLTQKQAEFLKALGSKKYNYLLFGGGMGGGKTQLMARIFLSLAQLYPNTRYAIFRKNMITLKRTTYQTFKQVADDWHVQYQENRAEMVWTITANGGTSQIWFSELDETKDHDFNKIKSFELTACGIDEANEVDETAFNVLMARVGRCNLKKEHAFIYLSCNPDKNWVKERFYDRATAGTLKKPFYFLQSLPTDNPFLPREYIEALEYLPEAEYKRYVKGDWTYSNDPNQLIKFEWLKPLLWDGNDQADGMGVDVAREGNDRTIFCYRFGKAITGFTEYKSQDTHTTALLAVEKMKEKQIGADYVAVDVVGVGGGVVDTMRSQGYDVRAYNSGETPDDDFGHLKCKNKRAYDYWKLREMIQNNEVRIINNPQLIKELTNIRYFVTDKVIQIEAKPEIKKRLGYSPDYADALVIALSTFELPVENVSVGGRLEAPAGW